MNKDFVANQALKQAREGLQRGNKREARHWAQIAVSLAPDMEEPWLILASVARNRARIAYLEQALEKNPGNDRTQVELEQAYLGAVNEKPLTFGKGTEGLPAQEGEPIEPEPTVNPLRLTPFLRIAIPAVIIAATLAVAGTTFSALAAMRNHAATPSGGQIQYWSQVDIPKPSDVPPPATIPATAPSPMPPASTATSLPANTAQALTMSLQQNPIPTLGQAITGKLIKVVIHEQRVYAYQGSTLVYSFVASTGANNNTRTGTYHVLDKIPNAYDPDRNFWMPDWLGIYYVGDLEDGFHSLPLLSNGQRLWGDQIGTPVTDGCVVLGITDSLKLYNWADVGTTVQINP